MYADTEQAELATWEHDERVAAGMNRMGGPSRIYRSSGLSVTKFSERIFSCCSGRGRSLPRS
jgi:hypothetical protein